MKVRARVSGAPRVHGGAALLACCGAQIGPSEGVYTPG